MPAATTPKPTAVPQEVEDAIAPIVTKHVESALASRASAPATQPVTSRARDLLIDAPEGKQHEAAMGLRIKSAFMAREEKAGRGDTGEMKSLRDFMVKVKAAGVYESVFEQGGALWARETRSAELIELLRPRSILLRAGARVESNYGSALTIGRLNEGAVVYWEAEGKPGTKSGMKDGLVRLGAHKAIALVPVSNSLIRKGTIQSASDLGADMAAAVALEVDKVGLLGKGPKKPNGVYEQTASGNKSAIAGTTTANKISDLKGLIGTILAGNHELEGNAPFYSMTSGTMLALSNERDSAGWVFPGLQDFKNPTINGYPVLHTESLAGKQLIGFGLARQVYFGEATPLEIVMGEADGDFESDMVTLRGVTEVDWALRHTNAFAFKTGVTY